MKTKKKPGFNGPEICALSAYEVVGLLRKGDISPHEALAAARARTEAVEPAVNAMPTRCWDRAEAHSTALDDSARDHPGWLAGLPLGIKDLTNVSGVRTTFGTRALADNIPDKTDPLVKRLEARGGLVVGKTNSPEMGAGGNTFNEVFGKTRNPWDTSLNAGGSSGGAAASLATGEVWLSHGSDLAGSIRTPAAYCGVVGLRPSPGIVGSGPDGLLFKDLGVQGPMARSVLDCALFLDAMAGFDPLSPLSFPAPATSYQDAVHRADGKLRIAFSPDLNGFTKVSRSMEKHLRAALEKVAGQGATVVEDCPELPELSKTYRDLRGMFWAALARKIPDEVTRHFKPTLAGNIRQGEALTLDDIHAAEANRSHIFENMSEFLTDFDVLACPVNGLHPGPVEAEYPTMIDGCETMDYVTWLEFAYLSPVTGLPAISVPVGLNDDGVPVGLQLIGPHRGEAKLLAAARAVEMAVGGPLGPIDPRVTHNSDD
jgi:amidase